MLDRRGEGDLLRSFWLSREGLRPRRSEVSVGQKVTLPRPIALGGRAYGGLVVELRGRETLAASKVQAGKYVEEYGKYFMTRWKELGNRPAIQYYNEAITIAPESDAAKIAEKRVAQLRAANE